MQKKIIWFILGASFLWVLFDFGKSSRHDCRPLPSRFPAGSEIDERIIGAVTQDILEAKFSMIK